MTEPIKAQDGYGSHLPILDRVTKEGSRIIEFGAGLHSTPFFAKRGSFLFSIEMQDVKWLHKVRSEAFNSQPPPNVQLRAAIGPWAFLGVALPSEPFDLGFVDGHGKSRFGVVNYLMRLGVPIIVAHDTEALRYHWDRVATFGYRRRDYKNLTPHTSVWTKVGS